MADTGEGQCCECVHDAYERNMDTEVTGERLCVFGWGRGGGKQKKSIHNKTAMYGPIYVKL